MPNDEDEFGPVFDAAQLQFGGRVIPYPSTRPSSGPIKAAADAKVALWSDSAEWSEGGLPKRPWVVAGYMMRGSVTVVAGPGSVGKSTLMLAWAVALALGEPAGAFVPPAPGKVLVYNVEDDRDEQMRRISAALRPFGRSSGAIAGRIIRCGPNGVGTLLEYDQMLGRLIETPTMVALEALIEAERPDAVMLDPLVELHTGEENDNTVLRLIVARLRQIARKYACAVVIVHHTRKGAQAGDVDAVRGAGAIVGAARAVFTVSPMTEAEAEELGQVAGRRRFFRVDSVKANYAPASGADWHVLEEYDLDNEERLAAAVPWKPPTAAAGPALEAMALIAAAVARGTLGGPYSPRMAPDQARSIAPLLAEHGITRPTAQKQALRALLANGFRVQAFTTGHRDARNGIRAPDGGPEAKWVEG